MVKTKTSKKSQKHTAKPKTAGAATRASLIAQEADSIYILKLVLYLILGSQWLRVNWGEIVIPLPVGLIIGIIFAHAERYPIDRKIQYAILLLSMFIGFWLPIGFEVVI